MAPLHIRTFAVFPALLLLAACAQPQEPVARQAAPQAPQRPQAFSQVAADASAAQRTAAGAEAGFATMVVHKSPTCGCCGSWVEHMQAAGFKVEVREAEDINPIKEQLGVPYGKGSCHTAEIGGYFVEGHVPADDIKRLLAERPEAKGLVLPGMPAGSPGMEMPDGRTQPYTVELVKQDGALEPFASH